VTVLALWKPYGVVSRFTPEAGHPSLRDFVSVRDVYPVGRLDADSEGLLLLSDDGPLAHALTDPSHAHPRTYWVQVEHEPDADALAVAARDRRMRSAFATSPRCPRARCRCAFARRCRPRGSS